MKKIFKRVICAMLVILFVFSFVNVAFAADIIVYNSDVIEPELYNTASNGSFDNLEAYIGDIEEFQKYILNCLMTDESNLGSLTGRGNIDVSMYNIPVDDAIISELMNLLWYESPELFRLSGSMSYSYTSSKLLELKPNYEFSTTEDFKMWYDVFVDVVSDLVSGIKGNTTLSEAEKALLLHDRLITYCEYDYESYCQGMVPQSSYSAYGVFCMGVAVCQGYALAYDYLLEQVGIEAEHCSSDTLNHAWNIVYIDGKPYYVDTTNDDPVWDVPGRVEHSNFLRSPEAFKKTGHNANDYKVIPSYTTYDNAFWQNSTTEFQLIDNKIYYIDNVKQELNVIDDITDTIPEKIAELNYRWTTANGNYYPGNYSKLAAIRENLFYSTPTTVYCYNTTTKKTETVITEEDIIEITGEDIYRIYAMSDYCCTLAVKFTETPNFNAETKNGHGYWGGYHNPTENWVTVIKPTNSSQGKEVNVCIDCGRELASRFIPALDDQHIWTDWYIDPNNKPTCTDGGVELRDCTHCDIFEWRYGTKLGHNYSTAYTVDVEPTCVKTGVKSRHCTRCDNRTDITEIPTTGHKEVVIPAVAPTYTTVGKTEGKKCSVCGTITVAQKDVSKLTLEIPVVKVANASNGVKVTWNKVANAEKYIVYSSTYNTKTKKWSSWKNRGTVTTTSWTDTNAKSGTKYKYTVRAVNGSVKSEYKSSSSILFLAQPTVKIANASTGVKVTWNKITGATGYKVYRSVYSNGKWSGWKSVKTIDKASTITWTDKSAKSGVKYKYTVKAVNGKTASTYKSSSSLLYLAQPTVTVKAVSNGVKVAWTQSSGATEYKIYRSEYNAKTKKWSGWKSIKTAKSTSKSYTDKSAKKGVKYRYTVKAVNGKVASTYKASGSVKR